MMDRLEMAAWLRDTGHGGCADDLIAAAPADVAAVAYSIAEHVEENCGAPQDPQTEGLPDRLRNWADHREFADTKGTGQ